MSRNNFLVIVIITLLIAYLGWLGYLGLRAEEPRRAIVSVEMMMNGDYLMPHLIGWPYYNKPPLFNWVMIPFFKLFGSFNEWVVRLPSTLSLLLLAFLNWKWIRKYIHKEVALLSSLFLLASADILYYGSVNTGEIDIFYAFLVYLNILVMFIFLERKQYLWLFVLSYFLAALGFLTKGPPSVLFQGLTLLAGLLYFRKFKKLFSWQHFLGILVFLAFAGGYMFLIYERGELSGFLIRQVKESTQRTGIESNFYDMAKGLWENPGVLLKISLPWSLSLLALFNKKLRKKVFTNRLVIFSLLAVAVNFPVYWITGELRARYIYPIVPFLCIVYAAIIYEGYSAGGLFKAIIDKAARIFILLLPLVLTVAWFIPSLHMDTLSMVINGALIAASILLFLFVWRRNMYIIYSVVLLMAFGRIAMNNIYLKLYDEVSETTLLKGHVSSMIDLAGDGEIDMTGSPYVYNSTIKLLGSEYLQGEVVVPMILSYQVPYYYALHTGKTIDFVPDPEPGKHYLLIDNDLDKFPSEVLYSYIDLANRNKWHLVRIKGPE
jgi:4-amino-4-deoxy-L-arabinose transferase-like glycosyltransferase